MSTLDKDNYFTWHPFTNMYKFYESPLIFNKGKDVYVTDVEERTFINATSGLWNLSLGMGNQEMIDAITEQLSKLSYASLFRMGHEASQRYAQELVKVLPGELNKVFFTSNGSEAVETMIKVARQFYRLQGKKEKHHIICLKRAYHGVSYGALSASGFEEDQEMYEPLLPGFIHIDPPYCLRCPYKKTHDSCQAECAKEIEETIKAYGEDRIAGFLMEPVLGFGGFIVPPDKFFTELKSCMKKHDILFMLDEVTTGFGRTGKLFAAEHWDLYPDMMSVGKAMSGGYMPLGAALFTDRVFAAFLKESDEERFNHGSTFSGHPASCAAGRKALEIYMRENILDKVHQLETALFQHFRHLEELPCVAQVRGKGAMLGVEFVTDKDTLTPLDSKVMHALLYKIFSWGVLVHLSGNNILIIPPYTLPVEQVKKIYNAVALGIKDILTDEVKLL